MEWGIFLIQNTMFALQTKQPIAPTMTGLTANAAKDQSPAEVTRSFGAYLQDALQEVDNQENQVHQMTEQFMLGEVNVDQLMVASERALLNLQLTTNVRNKVVEAYQEIMRMQM